jgi:hypothetical protein
MYGKKRFWIPLIVLAAVSVFSFLLLILWNWLMPTIFNLPLINFYQAFGLLLLSKLLFSGIHHRGRPHHFGREAWRKEFERKISNAQKPNTEEGK